MFHFNFLLHPYVVTLATLPRIAQGPPISHPKRCGRDAPQSERDSNNLVRYPLISLSYIEHPASALFQRLTLRASH
jgi:hypothetical protein